MKTVIIIDSAFTDGIEVFSNIKKAYKIYKESAGEVRLSYNVLCDKIKKGGFIQECAVQGHIRIFKRKVN